MANVPRTVNDLREALEKLQDARDRHVYYLATPEALKDDAAMNKLAVIQSAIVAFEAVIFSDRPKPEPPQPEASPVENADPDKGHLFEVANPPEARDVDGRVPILLGRRGAGYPKRRLSPQGQPWVSAS